MLAKMMMETHPALGHSVIACPFSIDENYVWIQDQLVDMSQD